MLKDIEYDEDNARTKLAKLFDSSNMEVIVKIITDECTADIVKLPFSLLNKFILFVIIS